MSQVMKPLLPKVIYKVLRKDAELPKQAHDTDAGFDIQARFDEAALKTANSKNADFDYSREITCFDGQPHYMVYPGERVCFPTGLSVQLPKPIPLTLAVTEQGIIQCMGTWQLEVVPRSGLTLKHGLTVLNTPGTVDAGFTGEIGIILINSGDDLFHVYNGDRIAQIKYSLALLPLQEIGSELENTERGDSGFGDSDIEEAADG